MKPLKISPKNRQVGLFIYCNKCKVGPNSEGECHLTKKKCAYPEKHVYKVRVHKPGTQQGRKSKVLNTRDELTAIKLAIDEQSAIKNDFVSINDQLPVVKKYPLHEYVLKFLDYNYNPPKNQPQNSPQTISDYKLHLKVMVQHMLSKGINPKMFNVEKMNDVFAKMMFDYISTCGFSPRTQHKYFKTYSTFCKYLIKVEDVDMKNNPFDGWNFNEEELDNHTIEESEFVKLLNAIDADNPKYTLDSKGRITYHYYSWLKDAICLGLFTGGRRQEIPLIKWTDIYPNKQTNTLNGGVLILQDIKNTSIQKLKTVKKKPVEINDDLADLLMKMGYHQNVGKEKYLIDGDEKLSRNHIKNSLSKSFAYYIKFVDRTGPKLTFKCLRKTWFTNCRLSVGESMASFMGGHSSAEVTRTHYINKLEAAGSSMKFRRIFEKNIPPEHTSGYISVGGSA